MKQVLILGNGISRKKIRKQIQDWPFDLWVCNWGYKEATTYKVDRVYSVHPEVIEKAFQFRQEQNLFFLLYSKEGSSEKADAIFKKNLGWSTGNIAIVDAFEEGYERIYLAGFDFGGSDIYQPHQLPGGNFFKQFQEILQLYDKGKIVFLQKEGQFSVDQMTQSKINSFWEFKEKKQDSVVKKIPYFSIGNDDRSKSILIIGNSPEVLDFPLGKKIDSFDVVIRINDYVTEGFEDQIGTKTSIWFTGASKVARKRLPEELTGVIPILGLSGSRLHLNENDKLRDTLKKDIEDTFGIPISEFKTIPYTVIDQLKLKHNFPSPTTGFLAIYFFVEYLKLRNVTLHGFDFFRNPYHYYDQDKVMKTKLSTAHDGDRETAFVQKLIDSKRVKLLSDTLLDDSIQSNHIFVFGNSPEVNKVDFNRIRQLKRTHNFYTVGVNRIVKVFQPDLFFFMDIPILDYILENKIEREKTSRWVVPSYLFQQDRFRENKEYYGESIQRLGIEVLNINFYAEINKKSSLLWAIHYLSNRLFSNSSTSLYLIGVELNVSNQAQYFDHTSNKEFSPSQISLQYNSQFNGLLKYYQDGVRIVSMTENSRLNTVIPYEKEDVVSFIESKVPQRRKYEKALVSMLTPEFLIAYQPFVKSLLHYNPWFNLPIVLLSSDLTEENKQYCRGIYPNTVFRDIQKEKYSKIRFSSTTEALRNTYYKLDIFSLYEYEKVVFIDLDVVFQGDISELFSTTADISLVPAYNAGSDTIGPDFNSGVIVLNSNVINQQVYDAIIAHSEKGFSLPDQIAINEFFKGRIHPLHKMYNCEKRLLKSKRHFSILERAVIIHFVSQKPWDAEKTAVNQGFSVLENRWWAFKE